MEEIKELGPGQYRLPKGYVAKLLPGCRELVVRMNMHNIVNQKCCRDCKHFAEGHSTRPDLTTTVCTKMPKLFKFRLGEPVQMYFARKSVDRACDMFEEKKS